MITTVYALVAAYIAFRVARHIAGGMADALLTPKSRMKRASRPFAETKR